MTTTINASTVSGLIQTADTSGSLQLQTVNLPAVTIDSSQNTTLAGALTVTGTTTLNSSVLKFSTAKAYNWNGLSTNTVLDFTDVPLWVKRISVIFNNVALSGTANYLIQLGTGTPTYVSSSINLNGASASNAVSSTTGIIINANGITTTGILPIVNITGNTWDSSHSIRTDGSHVAMGGGSAVLSAALDRIRITSSNGTDTFNAGSINIIYE